MRSRRERDELPNRDNPFTLRTWVALYRALPRLARGLRQPSLRELIVSSNLLERRGEALAGLERLEKLHVGGNRLVEIPAALLALPSLVGGTLESYNKSTRRSSAEVLLSETFRRLTAQLVVFNGRTRNGHR